jgi:hypothetical protein
MRVARKSVAALEHRFAAADADLRSHTPPVTSKNTFGDNSSQGDEDAEPRQTLAPECDSHSEAFVAALSSALLSSSLFDLKFSSPSYAD